MSGPWTPLIDTPRVMKYTASSTMEADAVIKHRNLVAPQIKSLVGDTTFVLGGNRAFEDIFTEVLTSLGRVFDRGRRLRETELTGVMGNLDALIRNHLPIIRAEHDFLPPTRTRPKGEAHEFRYVFLGSVNGGEYRLVAMRLLGTRKTIKLETHQLPVGFTYHAAERYLERSGKTGDALTDLGRCLLDNMVFYKLTEIFCARHLGFDLMFAGPHGKGAVLGGLYPTSVKAEGFEFRIEGIREYSFEPLWPPGTCYTANTYISEDQIGIDQIAVVEDIEAWKRERAVVYEEVQRLSCWRDSIAARHPDLSSEEISLSNLIQSAAEVLDTPEHRKAIPRNQPPPFFVSGEGQRL